MDTNPEITFKGAELHPLIKTDKAMKEPTLNVSRLYLKTQINSLEGVNQLPS